MARPCPQADIEQGNLLPEGIAYAGGVAGADQAEELGAPPG